MIIQNQNDFLINVPTMEEIYGAVQAMNQDGATGPRLWMIILYALLEYY